MATSTFTPGSYTVSGISPARTGIAESFQAGQQANLNRRTTRQQMQERDQMMKLRELQEQRTQAQFEAAQAARAQAAARAAQERAAFDAYTRAVTAEPTVRTAAERRPVDDFRASGGNFPLATPPQRSPIIPELGFPSPAGTTPTAPAGVRFPSVFNQTSAAAGTPLSMGVTPTGPAGGVQVASLDPIESFRAAFQARPDLFGGGVQVADASGALPTGALPAEQPVRVEFRGIPFDVYPDGRVVNTVTNTELPMTGEYDALRSALTQQTGVGVAPQAAITAPEFREVDPQASALVQDVQGMLRQGDIAGALSRIQVGLATGKYGPMGSPLGRAIGYAFDSPEEAARRTAVREATQWFNDPANERRLLENPDLITEAAADPISFVARQAETVEAVEAEEPAEPRTSPERTGQDPFIVEEGTPTGPIAGLSPAGAANPVAATEAAAAAAPGGDTSAYLISNPNLVLDLQTQLARERQVLEARLEYAQQTGNRALFDQTFDALNSRERVVNENMIAGQIAILAAQQDNFGPLQELMQRAYPNDNIEVIPYTNGTVSFFINGQESGEPQRTLDLLSDLAQEFNTEYRDALAAAAQITAEREQFLFENIVLQQLQAEREISVEQAKALAEIEATYGKATYVSDMESGDKLFQVLVPGRGYVMFRIVEAGQPLLNGKPAASATVEEIPQGALR